jgi:alpha-L-fucosidase
MRTLPRASLCALAYCVATLLAASDQRPASQVSELDRNIRVPEANGHLLAVAGYVEDTIDPDYRHASVDAYEAFYDLKFGVRIHWGLYSIWNLQNESWPFLKMSNEDRARYQKLYREWNPTGFDAEEWVTIFKEAGMTFFTFTSKHHEGFSMFDTATRVRERVNWEATGGPKLEECDLAYSIMETPFKRDVVGELTAAAHRHGLKIDLYFSLPDWYDADFRPYAGHPLQVPDIATRAPHDLKQIPRRFNADHPPQLVPNPTPEQEDRMMTRLRDQLVELLTNYGKIDMIGLDMWLGPRTWPRLKATIKELRGIQPDVMFRARGIGNYGDYFTPEGFVPGDKQNTGMPWFVIYPLARSFSYDPEAANYKGAKWIIHTLVDSVAKGGNFEIGIGPDAWGRFHPEAVSQMREAGRWLATNGEAIYGTRPRGDESWRDGDNVRFTRTKASDAVFAICLDWPAGNELVLHGIHPRPGSDIVLLGVPGAVSWRTDGGDTVIDLRTVAHRPESLAYVFKLQRE